VVAGLVPTPLTNFSSLSTPTVASRLRRRAPRFPIARCDGFAVTPARAPRPPRGSLSRCETRQPAAAELRHAPSRAPLVPPVRRLPDSDLFPSGPSDLRGASERSTLPRRGSGPKGEGRCRPLFTLWSFGPKRVAVCCSAAAPHLRCAEGRASRLCDALSCACGGNSLPRGAVAGCPASLPAPQRGATPAPLAYGLWHATRGVLNRPQPYDASSPLAVERQNRTGHWSSAAAAR